MTKTLENVSVEEARSALDPDVISVDLRDLVGRAISPERGAIAEAVSGELIPADATALSAEGIFHMGREIATSANDEVGLPEHVRTGLKAYLELHPDGYGAAKYAEHMGLIAYNPTTVDLLSEMIRRWTTKRDVSDADDKLRESAQWSDEDLFKILTAVSIETEFGDEGQLRIFDEISGMYSRKGPWLDALTMTVEWKDLAKARVLESVWDAANKFGKSESAKNSYDVVRAFMLNHNLDEEGAEAYIEHVMPRVVSKDPALIAITESHGWGDVSMRQYGRVLRYRPEEFTLAPLVSRASPIAVREWIDALKDIPTSDRFRVEQNRIDAIRISIAGGEELRQIIHDDKPGAHEAVSAMLGFAKDGDEDTLRNKISGLASKYGGFGTDWDRLHDQILTIDYNSTAKKLKTGSRENAVASAAIIVDDASVLDVMHRLYDGTISIEDIPPKVLDAKLQGLLDNYKAGSGATSEKLIELSDYINAQLQGVIESEQVGVEPSFVEAVAWLEREQFVWLKGLSYEDMVGFQKSPYFKQVLLTHELTHNDGFSQQEFDAFTDKLRLMNESSAARLIVERITGQIKRISDYYTIYNRPDWSAGLWSGNVTHELLGLVDDRAAETAVGRKLQRQRQAAGMMALHGLATE